MEIIQSYFFSYISETDRAQAGRGNSRFRGLNRISLLFPKRKPFIPRGSSRGRSTEAPFTTSGEAVELTGFGSRSTQRPFTTPTPRAPPRSPIPSVSSSTSVETTTENALVNLFRNRATKRPPFRPRVRTTR